MKAKEISLGQQIKIGKHFWTIISLHKNKVLMVSPTGQTKWTILGRIKELKIK